MTHEEMVEQAKKNFYAKKAAREAEVIPHPRQKAAEERLEAHEKKPTIIRATPYLWVEPEDVPERDWLYAQRLQRKTVSCTAAPGGTGKTSLIIVDALAMVSDRALVGHRPVGSRLKVWYWNLEDTADEITRRVQACAKQFGLSREDLGDRLFVNNGRDTPLVIAEMDQNGVKICRPVVDALIEQIRLRGIDVLIVDPYISCHRVPENDNGAQDAVVKQWGVVADRGNCAVELVPHTRKGDQEITPDSIRGGRALVDGARSIRVLNGMTQEEANKAGVENHRLYFRAIEGKQNFAPPPEKSDWFKIVGLDLWENKPNRKHRDTVGVATSWQWPDFTADVTGNDFEKVAAIIRADQWRADVRAEKWAGKAIAQALCLDLQKKADKAKASAVLKMYLDSGSLITVEGDSPNSKDGERKVKYVRAACESASEEGQ
jgi:RecA-family ATPase